MVEFARELRGRLPHLILRAAAWSGWLVLVIRAVQSIAFYALGPARDSVFLYDWRVYYAGALDLVARQLYRDGGIAVGNLKMPVEVYNNPPLSAVLPIPLLPLGYEVGGLVWVVAGAVAVVASGLLASRIVGTRTALTWFGVFWLLYVIQPFFVRNVVLGNVNSFMLLVVIGFCWAHLAGRHRAAGILLGLAIAIKVWPLLIALLLVREKRWRELGWAAGFVAVQGALLLVWLGPDVLPEMAAALRTVVPIPAGVVVLWTSWARESLEWWPAWGSLVVAGVLLAIPARGRLGLGIGIVAGLSLIPNLWDHYLPTFAFAGLLILTSAEAQGLLARLSRSSASLAPTSR